MDKDKKIELEKARLHALNHARNILPSIKSLEEELGELKRKYKDYKEQYEKADYALAQTDERLEKVNIGRRGKKVMELSLDQIKSIAEKLGVRL
jgi:hypothetical protein